MVNSVSPVQITSMAQYNQLAQQAIAATTLNPDLQNYANIINDSSGKYLEQDKLNAYTTVYNSYQGLIKSVAGTDPTDETRQEIAQNSAFLLAIQGSSVTNDISDAQYKIASWTRYGDGSSSSQAVLWASLSNIQQQLPQAQVANPNAGSQSTATTGDTVTVSVAAQALFRGDSPITELPVLTQSFGGQLYQNDLNNTVLTSGLQKLPNIINDTTGTYSVSDKVSAYTTAYSSFNDLIGTAYLLPGGQSDANTEELQQQKFLDTIQNSNIGKAAADGEQKQNAFQATLNGPATDAQALKFYNSLSDLQKLLPQFANDGTPLAQRIAESATRSRGQATGIATDQNLVAAELPFGISDPAKPSSIESAQLASKLSISA